MRFTLRKFGFLVLSIYLLFTCYTSYSLFSQKWRNFFHHSNLYLKNSSQTHYEEKLRDFESGPKPLVVPAESDSDRGNAASLRAAAAAASPPRSERSSASLSSNNDKEVVVEIWGKAAIGLFLWEHILKGSLEERLGGIWSYGSKRVGRFKFRFRTGAGVIPEKVPTRDVENLVLVLNGRETAKQEYARMWLDFVVGSGGAGGGGGGKRTASSFKNVGVVLLGREDCDNDWLLPYMAPNGGSVKFAFLVYDSKLIDDVTYFQWPLGVATYRNFPKQCLSSSEDEPPGDDRRQRRLPPPPATDRAIRMYSCNFLGTVYPNSSREELVRVLKSAPIAVQRACMIKLRAEWTPKESEETLAQYVNALTRSDLTLNPPGKNPECYRHYEAMACGSVPVTLNETADGVVVDDTPDKCDPRASLRLFRRHEAPFIWLEEWSELPALLAAESRLSQEAKIVRRRGVTSWYRDFLIAMRRKFVNVLEHKFHL